MTTKTHSTTYNPLGNITISGSTSYATNNIIYAGGGSGGGGGTGAYTWATNTSAALTPNQLHVTGDAEFQGNITVKGRNLTDWLETVDSRLGILQANPGLETEFDELRALGDAYREAERRFLEQRRIYDILKTTDE